MRIGKNYLGRSLWKVWVTRMLAWTLLFTFITPFSHILFAYAANDAQDDSCIHHPKHTEMCGYLPGNTGISCSHVHDETCGYIAAQQGSPCMHIHDAECGYVQAVDEIPCNMMCGQTDEDGNIIHQLGCSYRPASESVPCNHIHNEICGYSEQTEGSPCNHIHDEKCGYVESTEGHPCTYQCELCVTGWTWNDTDGIFTWNDNENLWGLGIPGVNAENPVTPDLLTELLPDSVTAETAAGNQSVPITWDYSAIPDHTFEGNYTLTATMQGEYVLTENAPALQVKLELGGGQTQDAYTALALNEWTWEKLNEQGEKAVIKLNRNGISTPEQLISALEKVLPQRIYGTSSGNKETARPNDGLYTFVKYDSVDKKSWGYLTINWNGLEQQIKDQISSGKIILEQDNTFIVKAAKPAGTVEYTINRGWGVDSQDELPITVNMVWEKQLFAVNEWTWEGFNEQGENAIVALNIDGIATSAQLTEALKKVLPQRIYGSSSGNKQNVNIPGYMFEKYDESAEPKKSWGYLEVDWSSLQAQIEEKWGADDRIPEKIIVEAAKPNREDIKYIINDTWDGQDYDTLPITIQTMSFSNHTVQAASPNVTVDLFDYWVKTEDPTAETGGDILDKSDAHYHEEGGEGALSQTITGYSTKEDWNLGINQEHLLLFGDGLIHAGLWNKGAGENCRYGKGYAGMEGIVKNTLSSDGYPEMNLANAKKILTGDNSRDYTLIKDYKLTGDHNDANGTQYDSDNIQNLSNTVIDTWGKNIESDTESLQYLFDPNFNHANKTSYTDVKGLFQLDDDGYYYYNMRKNFAEFSQDGGNHFILYDAPATLRTDGDTSVGNFFPFNKSSEVFNGVDENGHLTSMVPCSRNTMNHHLGMTVSAEFRQPANGRIHTSTRSQPMTFQFAGDDDVWVFIDDVLVLDLGGIHSELYGTIDFSTGKVCIGRAFSEKGIPDNPEAEDILVTSTTLKELYQAAGKIDATSWNSDTFTSNTSHTLKMFYLERGNYDSSIALRFNLQPLLYQRIAKVDQNGQALPDVAFNLYPAEVTQDTNAIRCLYTDAGERGKTFYVQQASEQSLVSLETEENGSAVFLTSENTYFNFADRGDQYYILKEQKAPAGYRKQPIDIVLHYDTSTSMLSVANRWTTGAYACSVAHIAASPGVQYGTASDIGITTNIMRTNTVPSDIQQNGLVVAVPLLQKKSDKNWLALYGSNLSGFKSVPITGNDEADWVNAVLFAALEQAKDTYTASWYLDWDEGNRRLRGTLNDLPGLAGRYDLNSPEGDMNMVYGILSPDALNQLGIAGATPAARYANLQNLMQSAENGEFVIYEKISKITDGFRILNPGKFNRDFRSLIYIPNERRELRVQKIDQNGLPLAGTAFGLYYDHNCENLAASGITDNNGMLVFSPNVQENAAAGYAKMVWADNANTNYYLKEITAPAGYGLNPTVTPIVVGIYSIYADAGVAGDGVSVMAGAGSLTQTMRQYAMGGDVDITLQDITAFMQTQPSGQFALNGWQDANLADANIIRSMNLHFGKNTAMNMDYGLHDEDGGKRYKPFFVTDTGFIRTRVQQMAENSRYENININANKDNLGDTDLTNLFSLLNVVVVTDQNQSQTDTGNLTISKMLSGDQLNVADYHKYFTFRLDLKDAAGNPLAGEFAYYFYGEDKAGYVSNGDNLILHHDEALTILGLPAGTQFTVTEQQEQNSGWYVKPDSGTVTGAIAKGQTAAAAFVNAKSPHPSEEPGESDDPNTPSVDPDEPDEPTPPNPPPSSPPSGGSSSKITHPVPPPIEPPIEPPVEPVEPVVPEEPVEPVQPPIETAQLPAETIAEEDPLFDLDALGIPRHFLLTEQEIEDAVPKAGARDAGTPETSDNCNGFWVLLHILSLFGLAVLCLCKYQKGKKREE